MAVMWLGGEGGGRGRGGGSGGRDTEGVSRSCSVQNISFSYVT